MSIGPSLTSPAERPGPVVMASGGVSVPLTTAEELAAAIAGIWMIVGLFLDGLAHVELKPDTFFTPWHLILYTGLLAATVAAVIPVVRRHESGASWMMAIPRGHTLTLLGVATFGVGAVFDFVWHELVGFEVSNEALLSPSHLVLLLGAVFAMSGPVRAGWWRLTSKDSLAGWMPMAISCALLTGVALFFTSYLSPFGRQSAAVFPTTRTHTHELGALNPEAFGQLRETWGISGILLSTIILLVPLLLVCRSSVPPLGVITILGIGVGLLAPALGEYEQWTAGFAVALAFVVADLLVRRISSTPVTAAVTAFTLWTTYFAGLELTDDVGWSPSLWVGSILLGAMVGAVVGLLAGPGPTTGSMQEGSDGERPDRGTMPAH